MRSLVSSGYYKITSSKGVPYSNFPPRPPFSQGAQFQHHCGSQVVEHHATTGHLPRLHPGHFWTHLSRIRRCSTIHLLPQLGPQPRQEKHRGGMFPRARGCSSSLQREQDAVELTVGWHQDYESKSAYAPITRDFRLSLVCAHQRVSLHQPPLPRQPKLITFIGSYHILPSSTSINPGNSSCPNSENRHNVISRRILLLNHQL